MTSSLLCAARNVQETMLMCKNKTSSVSLLSVVSWVEAAAVTLWDHHPKFLTLSGFYRRLSSVKRPWHPSLNQSHNAMQDYCLRDKTQSPHFSDYGFLLVGNGQNSHRVFKPPQQCVRSLKDVIVDLAWCRLQWAKVGLVFFVSIIKTEWENRSIFPAALDLVWKQP